MPRLSAALITLTPEQHQALERLIGAHSTPQKLAERARMIALAASGRGVHETARELGVWPKTVRHWRGRWLASKVTTPVAERLADAPRSGAPATFTSEQICAIIALACEKPKESELPISHWSQSEVAREAVKRGIVESISHGSVGRFFKRSGASAASRAGVADTQARSRVRSKMC
jgi:transposase